MEEPWVCKLPPNLIIEKTINFFSSVMYGQKKKYLLCNRLQVSCEVSFSVQHSIVLKFSVRLKSSFI